MHVQPRSFAWTATSGSSGRVLAQLHQLKRKLLREALEAAPEAQFFKRLCGAANQAADLAWMTSHPLLVLPCLFEEHVQQLHHDFEARQFTESGSWEEEASAETQLGRHEAHPVFGLLHSQMADSLV